MLARRALLRKISAQGQRWVTRDAFCGTAANHGPVPVRTLAPRFVDPHTIEAECGLRLQADKIILCGGGTSRRLRRFWSLVGERPGCRSPRSSMPLAHRFNSSRTVRASWQDDDVSAAVAAAFRESGIVVRESFGSIEIF